MDEGSDKESGHSMKAIDADPVVPHPHSQPPSHRSLSPVARDMESGGGVVRGGDSGPPPLLHVPSQRLLQQAGSLYDSHHSRRQPPSPTTSQHRTVKTVGAAAGVCVPEPGSGAARRTPGDGSSGAVTENPNSSSSNRPTDMLLPTYPRSPHADQEVPHRTRAPQPEDSLPYSHHWHHPHSPALLSDPFLSAPYMGLPGKERLTHPAPASVYGHRRFSESALAYACHEGAGFYPPPHSRHHTDTPTHRWSPKCRKQKNGMMEEGGQQEGAINLSTGRDLPPGKDEEQHTNGDLITHNGHDGHDAANSLPQPPPRVPGKGTPVPALSGAAKRKNKAPADPAAAVAAAMQGAQQQNLLMLAAQQGLTPQQMQALQQQLVSGSPQSLIQQQQQQSLLLQHQQKVHEQALHQLNEQLQLNILRQSELLQQASSGSGSGEKGKVGGSKAMHQQLQQLAVQQQQLVQQIQHMQLQQRQYLLACLVQPFGMPQGMMSPAEMQALWKEVAAQSGLDESALKTLNGLSLPSTPTSTSASTANGQAPHLHSPPNFLANGSLPVDPFSVTGGGVDAAAESSKSSARDVPSPVSTALYRHNLCKWPGCDTLCEDYAAFVKHLNVEHQLDDRSTAQARVQLQVVSQLEIQLSREKELLQAMMAHLHMKTPTSSTALSSSSSSTTSSSAVSTSTSSKLSSSSTSVPLPVPPPLPPQPSLVKAPIESKQEPTTPILPKHPMIPPPFTTSPFLPAVSMVTSPMVPLPHTPTTAPHLLLSQPPPPLPPLLSQHSASGAGGVVSSGSNGGGGGNGGGGSGTPGPIRRRVSDKCNLPISTEIQRNREFYKTTDVRPPFTYASLIRQAIIESPHRQLTLNEIYQWFQATFAYFRRNEATWKNAVRHNLSLHKCFMRVENVKGAVWTVDEVEFYKRRPQKLSGGNIKSPSLSDPASYNETINATIRAALGEASLAMMSQGGQLMDQDMAQDLSLKSVATSSSQDGIMAMARSLGDDEMLLNIKREAGLDPDTPTFLDGSAPGPDGPIPGARIMVPLPPKRSASMDDPPPLLLASSSQGASPPPGEDSMEGEAGQMEQEGDMGPDDTPLEDGEMSRDEYVRVSPRTPDHDRYTHSEHQADYAEGEESLDPDMAQHYMSEQGALREQGMMGEDSLMEEGDVEGGESREEDGSSQQGEGGEEESVEDSLREEGPQPGLEAEDELVDNLPVFPVPQLQPVTST